MKRPTTRDSQLHRSAEFLSFARTEGTKQADFFEFVGFMKEVSARQPEHSVKSTFETGTATRGYPLAVIGHPAFLQSQEKRPVFLGASMSLIKCPGSEGVAANQFEEKLCEKRSE